MCHLMLLLPVLALPVFWVLPLPAAAAVYAVVAAASVWVYAAALQAMRMPRLNDAEGMLGLSGIVADVGERGVTLLVRGELWTIEAESDNLAVGDRMIVVGIEGLRLRARRPDGALP